MGRDAFAKVEPSCMTCRFCDVSDPGELLCRRYALRPHDKNFVFPYWPGVLDTDWCGEWSERW